MAKELKSALSHIKLSGEGVYVQASTLGSLEALLDFLRSSKIPVSTIVLFLYRFIVQYYFMNKMVLLFYPFTMSVKPKFLVFSLYLYIKMSLAFIQQVYLLITLRATSHIYIANLKVSNRQLTTSFFRIFRAHTGYSSFSSSTTTASINII